MRRIQKKTTPEYVQDILEGRKNFEVKLADWECKVGDILVLREWHPKTTKYTGRVIEKKVVYVLKTKEAKLWSKEEISKYGFQIIGFKD